MLRNKFVNFVAATVPLLVLSGATTSADELPPKLRPGAIVVTGKTVQVLDGEGNFFTTSDTHIVSPPGSSNVLNVLFVATIRNVPNPDGLTVRWTFANTGIPCLFGDKSCSWQLIIPPNGQATLIGVTHLWPKVRKNCNRSNARGTITAIVTTTVVQNLTLNGGGRSQVVDEGDGAARLRYLRRHQQLIRPPRQRADVLLQAAALFFTKAATR